MKSLGDLFAAILIVTIAVAAMIAIPIAGVILGVLIAVFVIFHLFKDHRENKN